MSGQRVLVTGAQGCLGAWAVRAVLDDGDEAVGLDLGENLSRLELVLGGDLGRVTLVQGDITDRPALDRVLDEHEITRVVHLAALQVPFCRANPTLGASVNVAGTTNVFQAVIARGDRIPGIAYASSAAVYGSEPSPAREHEGFAPATVYGVFKLANEGTARVLAKDEGLASIGIRPYVVYGAGRDQGLTSGPTVAIPAVLRGEAYRIGFGGAAQYDFAPDVAATFVRAAHAATEGAIVGNYPGIRATVADVVEALATVLPEAADLVTWDDATTLPFPAELESAALERVLGPIPRTPLAEGLAQTVAHLRAAAG